MAKRNKYLLIVLQLIFSATFPAFSKHSPTDSLENELNKTKGGNERLEILVKLAKEFSVTSFEKGTQYAKEALSLARTQDNPLLEAEANMYLGDACSYQNRFDESNSYYNTALSISQKNNLKEITAILLNSIGLNSYFSGKYDKALDEYQKAYDFAYKAEIKKEEGNALFNMGQVYKKKNNSVKANSYYDQSRKVFESINEVNGLAKVYNSLGILRADSGDYKAAVNNYEKALIYRKQTNDKKGSAILYNNIGNIYIKWGKFENAITYFQNALKTFEQIGSQEGIARCSNNIGLVYENLPRGEQYSQNIGYYDKALEFHEKALKIWETLDNKFEIANAYNNIANVQSRKAYSRMVEKYGSDWENVSVKKDKKFILQEYTPAINHYRKSLAIREALGDKLGIAGSLTNLGKIYIYIDNYTQALTFLQRALSINEDLGNSYEVCCAYYEISRLYYTVKNNQLALEYLNKSLKVAQDNQLFNVLKDIYLLFSNLYQANGDYKESLFAYKHFVDIQDSILNENNLKQIAELQTQYETEKKEQKIQLLNKDAKLKDIQLNQRNIILYFVMGGFAVILVFSLLLIKQNKARQKANKELALKNNLITQQKQEITDSIHYARRIQNAVMSFETQFKQFLPESFIYFKPRDIVSGDFYWVAEKKGKIVVAAADCTGHGVPGAFMSMLGISLLNHIFADKETFTASQILNELRVHIIESLHQSGKEGENKDGMDIALYILDLDNYTLEFSGANNPLCIVRRGTLMETKADRMPIGIHEKADMSFTNHLLQLEKGDMIYSFSDGYSDQFGGPNNKKFMSVNMKKMFLEIHNKPVKTQSEILHATIHNWMKDISQIDDIMVIGVRV